MEDKTKTKRNSKKIPKISTSSLRWLKDGLMSNKRKLLKKKILE